MSKSLKDQLLKSGLVSEKDAKKAQADQKKQKKQQKKKSKKAPAEDDPVKAKLKQEMAEKKRRDAELNRKKQEEVEAKAIQAQIKQLIEMNIISREEGDIAFSFPVNNKIKKIYVTNKLQDQLSRGKVAVVKLNEDGYELVPAIVAEKIKQRNGDCVVFLAEASAQQANDEDDDPYADYQIPDDLMW